MTVLLTKLASMGDLIHLLPALTDAKRARPELTFHWVIDTHFQEVATWHPSVTQTLITNHRTWRSNLTKRVTWQEMRSTVRALQTTPYEQIIDAQGNLKSAFISLFAKGNIAGFDSQSVPEWGAHFLYHQRISASKKLHAIERLRLLLAKALEYPLTPSEPDYGIDKSRLFSPSLSLPSSYLLFVPIASHPSKLCTESFWQELISLTLPLGLPILIPSGSKKEEERAKRLARTQEVIALPRLPLSQVAFLIDKAQAVLSLDTGLSHLAAALGTPSLTLYGPTDPSLIGTVGPHQFHLRTASLNDLSPQEVFLSFQRQVVHSR